MFRLKLMLRVAVVMTIVAVILFGSAGRSDLPFFWAYLALLGGFVVVALLTVPRELLEERIRPAEPGADNLVLARLGAVAILASQSITAGLDVGRGHWSDTVPGALQGLGLASMAVVFGVWYWAMRSNPFFSSAVRIQRDRGHVVVSSGPYRWVRHPGYATLVVLGWGGPLALGSWLAVLPHLAVAALLIRRAALEDRLLHAELEGYAAYAATVRYRLVPGLW